MGKWECEFTYVSVFFAVAYFIMLLGVVWHLYRVFRIQDRKAQKLFLTFSLLQCLGRITFFTAWPFAPNHPCSPSTSEATVGWLDFVGTFPAAFFISAFTVNVFTFARIYHLMLKRQRCTFVSVIFTVAGLNVGIYVIYTVDLLATGWWNVIPPYLLAAASITVAVGFVVYTKLISKTLLLSGAITNGGGLGGSMGSGMDSASVSVSLPPPPPPHSSPSSAYSPSFSPLPEGRRRASTLSPLPQKDPLQRIKRVAVVCLCCFLVRAITLPLLANLQAGHYGPISFLFYMLISEVVPLCLMLIIFDSTVGPPPPLPGRNQRKIVPAASNTVYLGGGGGGSVGGGGGKAGGKLSGATAPLLDPLGSVRGSPALQGLSTANRNY